MPKRGQPSPVKGRTFEKESYTSEEVRALLARTSSRAPSAVRNHALICTLWQGGLRINEALELRPHDFDVDHAEIHVRRGKFEKSRRVKCGPDAAESVKRWLAVRGRLDLPKGAPLFCTLKGGKLFGTYVRATLTRLAQGAGWTKRVHPHGFRHTFAVNLVRNGVPAPYIQRQLGHASLDATAAYLASISADDIAEAMDRVEW